MRSDSIAIVTSLMDNAGMTIKRQLLKNYGFEEKERELFDSQPVYSLQIEETEALLYTIASEPYNSERLDQKIKADLFVFATRHSSKAGVPALTTHAVGNWGKAEFGGRDGTICPTSPSLLKLFLQNLSAVAKSESYTGEIVQESTHHGPFLEKPAVFIEVGSTEKEWEDEKLASMVADSLIGGLGDYVALEDEFIPLIGLGGPHYAANFRKLMLESKHAIGHICPKHHLSRLTPELLQQAMKSCNARKVALDWKGLGSEKEKVRRLVELMKLDFFKI